MSVSRLFARRAALTVLAAAALVSCARAASIFLDLPPEARPQQTSAAAAPRPDTAAPDTSRPPIEATLDPDSVRKLLPADADGNIDWVAALRARIIRPRPGLPGTAAPPSGEGFRFDFVYQGPDRTFDALFPHSSHVEWLRCESCHPAIFRYRNTPPTMADVNDGKACGQCHGKVAFPPTSCWRCHPAFPPPEAGTETEPAELLGTITLVRRPDTAQAAQGAAASFPPARFPHWVHRIRYRCSACHPGLFETRAGGDTLTMAGLSGGKACGRCHNGTAAFALLACGRCHVTASAARGPGA